MRSPTTTLATMLLGALLSQGCLLQADLDVPAVCVTQSGIEMPPTLESGKPSVQSFDQDSLQQWLDGLPEEIQTKARFDQATVSIESGPPDFAFLDSAGLTMQPVDDANELPPAVVASCREGCGAIADQVTVAADTELDAIPYLLSGALKFELFVRGQLPTEPWKVGVELCLSGRARARY